MQESAAAESRAVASNRFSALRVLLPFGVAYFASHWFRAINAVIAPDLVRELALSASALGLLSAAYFLAFSAFQIPLGILLDRFGPRRVNAALVACAALGALLFAQATSMASLTFARALIGLGVSGCLMAPIKAATLWFARERLAALNGWILFAGGLGSLAATAPAQLLLSHASWRDLFRGASLLALVAVVLLFWVTPRDHHHTSAESFREQLSGFARIFSSRAFWRVGAVAMLSQATYMGIQSLWAGPWLIDVARLSRASAANHLLAMAVAITLGAVFFGKLGSRFARAGRLPVVPFVGGVLLFCVVQLALALGWRSHPLVAWILFGFFGTGGTLAFAIIPHYFPPALTGRAITALNVLIFALAFVFQWGLGAIIELWPKVDGRYQPLGYQTGFAVGLALQLIALAWLWRQRNTQAAAQR